jgi:hypothetical protein
VHSGLSSNRAAAADSIDRRDCVFPIPTLSPAAGSPEKKRLLQAQAGVFSDPSHDDVFTRWGVFYSGDGLCASGRSTAAEDFEFGTHSALRFDFSRNALKNATKMNATRSKTGRRPAAVRPAAAKATSETDYAQSGMPQLRICN